ncbi:hypothetical protein [Flavobacterium sp.]|uniref:hypothetical protein n=1 Tax=Flavobacterium sp. TaxID=239 RepID=UPI002604256B|nr:hypothetical protein [Flavobacterium sp.]
MKKSLAILLILFISVSYSQNTNLNEENLKKVLCKTWIIDYIIENGKKIVDDENFKEHIIKFSNNKTYEIKSEIGYKTYKWEYNKTKKCVELFVENKVALQIKSIDDENLILIPILEEKKSKNIIHLKPIK